MTARTRQVILVVGIGGQGVLSTARALGDAVFQTGENVLVEQLHGMAQKGGSVQAALILGDSEAGLVEPGEARVLLALEPLEAKRAVAQLAPDADVILNARQTPPPSALRAGWRPPALDAIARELAGASRRVWIIDADAAAEAAGDRRALGPAILGALNAIASPPVEASRVRSALSRGGGRRAEVALRAFAEGERRITAWAAPTPDATSGASDSAGAKS